MECLEDGCESLSGSTGYCMKHHILNNPASIKPIIKPERYVTEVERLDMDEWNKKAKESQSRILNSNKYFVSKPHSR